MRRVSVFSIPGKVVSLFAMKLADITGRKKLQEQLRQSAYRLTLATDSGRIGIWDWDIVHDDMLWDDWMCRIYDVLPESAAISDTYQLWSTRLHPEDREAAEKGIADAIAGVRPFDTSFRVVWRDGSVHHIRATGDVTHDAAGVALRMVGVNWDVTSQIAQNLALRELTTRMMLAADSGEIGMLEIDLRNDVMLVDEWACRIFGIAFELGAVLPGDIWKLHVHPDDRLRRDQARREALDGVAPFALDYRIIRADGLTRHVKCSALITRDAAGLPIRMTGSIQDITESKEIEEALAETAKKLAAKAEEADDTRSKLAVKADELAETAKKLAAKAQEADETRINLAIKADELAETARKLAVKAEEADETRSKLAIKADELAETARKLAAKADEADDARSKLAIKADELAETARKLAVKAEEADEARSKLAVKADEADEVRRKLAIKAEELAATARKLAVKAGEADDTRTKLAVKADELAETARELKRSNEELSQFASIASHDLQEPLRMVASYTQLLSKRYKGRLDADADEFIAFAIDGTQRMKQLIQDLLAYSRVGTNGANLLCTASDEALTGALWNLQGAIEESGALVTHDALPAVIADASQLTQLFQNLVGNAIKYRGPAIPLIHISAALSADGRWQFLVRDNGLGIDAQHFDRIFGMFQRLHGVDEYSGTGIGLAICKKIVDRHGGVIDVDSKAGEGSCFHFTLASV
jgi:PAS domain S-box-containing protein